MSIPFSVYYNPHRPETPTEVAAGASEILYDFDLRSLCPDYVAFICDLAILWFPDTYIDWEIDGDRVQRLKRQVGDFKRPLIFDPPYLVEERIKFTAYNNDKSSHKFEILCDGILERRIT